MECIDSYILLTVWGFKLQALKINKDNSVDLTLAKDDYSISFARVGGTLIFKTIRDRETFIKYEQERKSNPATNSRKNIRG